MRVTLHIEDELHREAKAAAARQGHHLTLLSFVEKALRLRLEQPRGGVVALPTFTSRTGFPYNHQELKRFMRDSEEARDRENLT